MQTTIVAMLPHCAIDSVAQQCVALQRASYEWDAPRYVETRPHRATDTAAKPVLCVI